MNAIDTAHTRALLSAHFILRELSPGELEELCRYARVTIHAAEETLFQKGDPGDGMIAVISGRVRITANAPDGRQLILNMINPGEIFGEMALISDQPRSADAITDAPSSLLHLLRQDFVPFLEQSPRLMLRLLRVLSQRLRHTSEQLEESIFLDVPGRLSRRLLWLAEVVGKPHEGGILIDATISQQQLGNFVGATRESINKTLRTWRTANLIDMAGGKIVLRDVEALRRLTGD